MKQEELLQFIFLFIFVVLVVVLIGSTIGRFSFADTTQVVTPISVNDVTLNGTSTSAGGAGVWANHSFVIGMTGLNLNFQMDSKIIFAGPNGASMIKTFDCEGSTVSTVCSFTMDGLGEIGAWTGNVLVNEEPQKVFNFEVKKMCGNSDGQSFTFSTSVNCSEIASSNGSVLCNSPAYLGGEPYLTSDNKCKWNCSHQFSSSPLITDSCYFNAVPIDTNTASTASCGVTSAASLTASSTNLCIGGTVLGFTEKSDGSGWTWTCSTGVTPISCSATKILSGKCYYSTAYTSLPTAGSCSSGTVTDFVLSENEANWKCEGATIDTCSIIMGKCASFGEALTALPTTGLCIYGNSSTPVSSSTNWTWNCQGSNGGSSAACSAVKKITPTVTIPTIDASKIILNPSTVRTGGSVSVEITDTGIDSMQSLALVAKPILSTLTNQVSASLSKCSDGTGFCGSFTAPSNAGEWSISLYSSDGRNIPISALKTFIVATDSQIPIIATPVISPSSIMTGESVLIKLSVSGLIYGAKVKLISSVSSYSLISSLQLGACSDNKDLWCETVKIPTSFPGGTWTAKVISYIDSSRVEKTVASNIESSFNVKVLCNYNYSAWSVCNNGKRTRSVVSSYPTGCSDGDKILESTCDGVACTAYNYSAWSECANGKRTRRLVSAIPSGCLGNAILEETCTIPQTSCTEDKWECENWQPCSSTNKQIRKCTIVSDCALVSSSSPELTRECSFNSSQTSEVKPADTTANTTVVTYTKNDVSLECTLEGITDVNTCQDYIAQTNIVSSCISNGINDFNKCKSYLLGKYPSLVKCKNLKPEECEIYINDILLADLKNSLSEDSKKKLVDYVGTVAVIDSQQQVINVVDKKTGESSAIKVENIPVAVNNISVNLLPTEIVENQKYLSPVAITFDENKNGIPDDIELRLGTDIKEESLTGVDRAIITGESLEQPKFKKETLISGQLTIDQVENQKGGIRFQGKAIPNQIVTLFIYSTMPIVITVEADSNGNWIYELDKSLINGKHEAYVVINNSKGRIIEASLPKPFFIDEARAVAMDEFVRIEDASSVSVTESSDNFIKTYVGAGVGFIVLLIVIFLFIRKRASEQEGQ
ncbi:MAG: hypothetical protein WCX74_02890 [Candidatus Paceibacterota bacterium]